MSPQRHVESAAPCVRRRPDDRYPTPQPDLVSGIAQAPPARLFVPFLFAVVGCSTVNLRGVTSGAKWRGSDDGEIRSHPGWVKVDQRLDGKGFSVQGAAITPTR